MRIGWFSGLIFSDLCMMMEQQFLSATFQGSKEDFKRRWMAELPKRREQKRRERLLKWSGPNMFV
jgi:hypothetical protein